MEHLLIKLQIQTTLELLTNWGITIMLAVSQKVCFTALVDKYGPISFTKVNIKKENDMDGALFITKMEKCMKHTIVFCHICETINKADFE